MKRIIAVITLLVTISMLLPARNQWSERKALRWEKRVGVLKGANGYYSVHPARPDAEVLAKMHELGFNSVRAWIGGQTAEDVIATLEKLLDAADDYGMTVSPVLTIGSQFKDPEKDAETEPAAKEKLKTVISHFRRDKRIVYWDLWNEPPYNPERADVMRTMDILEKMVLWGREANCTQPLTSSILWDINNGVREGAVFKRRMEVEGMMDIHNYHDYTSGQADGQYTRDAIRLLKSMDKRPIVCSECLNRQNGSGIERALSIFAQEHVHFYVWGVYSNDRNWNTRWGKSEFDAYARMFHNVLYADGAPYNEQEIQWIKDFRFLAPGETMDPGTEITEQWRRDRIWKRMALGPVKGFITDNPGSVAEGYNNVNVTVSYQDWKKDPEAVHVSFEKKLKEAADRGCLVVPTLLTAKDGHDGDHEAYVRDIIGKYAHAPEVFAWNIYTGPTKADAVTGLFRAARSCQSTHPVFMIPEFSLQEMPENFNYRAAMIHGKTFGWDHFQFKDKDMEQICSLIWCLSDVTAFKSPFTYEKAGWIGAVARRYGRPVFAFLEGKPTSDTKEVLDLLSRTQLYWWTEEKIDRNLLTSFKFIPSNDWAD